MLPSMYDSRDLGFDAEAIRVVRLQRFAAGMGFSLEDDRLAIEEPLQISLQWFDLQSGQERTREWSLTMRTPGDDMALVTGLLLTHGVVTTARNIALVEPADDQGRHPGNHLLVTLERGVEPDWGQISRSYMSQSSCGICGLTSMRALSVRQTGGLDRTAHWLAVDQVMQMPLWLRAGQPLFAQTGAVHGAGYCCAGELVAVAEDVGRHNAVDKLIGHISHKGLWSPRSVLVLSGRVSFELMQKALIARIPVILAVGAPSSLAMDMARQFGMTLIGFTSSKQFNVYHGHWRLQGPMSEKDSA